MTVLLDTGFLLSLVNQSDKHHQRVRAARRELRGPLIVPAPVLPEVFYMVFDRMSYYRAVELFKQLQTIPFRIETLTVADMERMSEIMDDYADNEFDFVDTAIMAVSERLNISTICTIDPTDFQIFRPRHTDYLITLPE